MIQISRTLLYDVSSSECGVWCVLCACVLCAFVCVNGGIIVISMVLSLAVILVPVLLFPYTISFNLSDR